MSLGQDFAADAMAAFSGELYDATLKRWPVGTVDINNPTGPAVGDPVSYECEGIALGFEQEYIDGSRIMKGDYQVVILRGSLDSSITPRPGDEILIPPPNGTVPQAARVIHVPVVTEAQVTLHVRGVPV